MRPHLQYRVTLAFALFGALLSILLSVGLYLATRDVEERLIDETLTAEMQDYISRRTRNPHSPPPATTIIRGYVRPSARFEADIPPHVRELPAGHHPIQLNGRPFRAAVVQQGESWFYLLYDESQVEQRKEYVFAFLAAGVLLMTLISAALGRWLACRVVAPVGQLARRVTHLRPEESPPPLAADYPADEVGELARAFDTYLARLEGFIERERAFTAEVSHELRTPLAVIQGAAEVLLGDPNLEKSQRRRVSRISRAALEMTEVTQALLALAREDAGSGGRRATSVEEVLRQVLEAHQPLLRDRPVALEVAIHDTFEVWAEAPLVRILISNLVRNAFTYTHQGHIKVVLEATRLTIEDTGVGIEEEDLDQVFQRYYSRQPQGTGLGLSLVRRICDRYGWSITLQGLEPQGTTTRLTFADRSSLPA